MRDFVRVSLKVNKETASVGRDQASGAQRYIGRGSNRSRVYGLPDQKCSGKDVTQIIRCRVAFIRLWLHCVSPQILDTVRRKTSLA
jgi:hypothetical protein